MHNGTKALNVGDIIAQEGKAARISPNMNITTVTLRQAGARGS
jgi:hypothetical protein